MGAMRGRLRVLLVEDNGARESDLRAWLPDDIHLVWAKSAGQAIGVLKRDRGRVYAGILLDHDLQMQRRIGNDRTLTGQDVVRAIIDAVDTCVPILVHSMNRGGAPRMVEPLEGAGFVVTRRPWHAMTREILEGWLEEVREATED